MRVASGDPAAERTLVVGAHINFSGSAERQVEGIKMKCNKQHCDGKIILQRTEPDKAQGPARQ